jgi:Protein of unknown function (DUF1572)
LEAEFLRSAKARFAELKALGDRALERMDEGDLRFTPDPESNSIAIIVQHLAGNMVSRWTDFLTTDGEKPDRNRDGEFVLAAGFGRDKLLGLWEQGWTRLFETLTALAARDLDRQVVIRGQSLSVVDAIHRQLTHYGQHVGQIIYLAKHRKWQGWESLSLPKKRT